MEASSVLPDFDALWDFDQPIATERAFRELLSSTEAAAARAHQEALAIQRSLLVQLEQLGKNDGYVHEELAECLLALHQAGEAQRHFAVAYRELSADEWLVMHELARIRRLQELGQMTDADEAIS